VIEDVWSDTLRILVRCSLQEPRSPISAESNKMLETKPVNATHGSDLRSLKRTPKVSVRRAKKQGRWHWCEISRENARICPEGEPLKSLKRS
jgi:hypothetical protein